MGKTKRYQNALAAGISGVFLLVGVGVLPVNATPAAPASVTATAASTAPFRAAPSPAAPAATTSSQPESITYQTVRNTPKNTWTLLAVVGAVLVALAAGIIALVRD